MTLVFFLSDINTIAAIESLGTYKSQHSTMQISQTLIHTHAPLKEKNQYKTSNSDSLYKMGRLEWLTQNRKLSYSKESSQSCTEWFQMCNMLVYKAPENNTDLLVSVQNNILKQMKNLESRAFTKRLFTYNRNISWGNDSWTALKFNTTGFDL